MSVETKSINGQMMAILPAEELENLVEELDDLRDAVRFDALKAEADALGYMPAEILDLKLDRDLSPLAAWRTFRRLSQEELARQAGVTQPTVARIERGISRGRPATLKKFAAALDAPLWTLSEED